MELNEKQGVVPERQCYYPSVMTRINTRSAIKGHNIVTNLQYVISRFQSIIATVKGNVDTFASKTALKGHLYHKIEDCLV